MAHPTAPHRGDLRRPSSVVRERQPFDHHRVAEFVAQSVYRGFGRAAIEQVGAIIAIGHTSSRPADADQAKLRAVDLARQQFAPVAKIRAASWAFERLRARAQPENLLSGV